MSKYTICVYCTGGIDIYRDCTDHKYQTYNKGWKHAPLYYNIQITKGYTNLSSPILLKLLKSKDGHKLKVLFKDFISE